MKLGLCAAAAIVIVLAAGRPAPASGPEAGAFDRADANQDGVIDAGEWEQFSSGLFDRVDRDGDGAASAAELDEAFETFDYNRDGVIDGRESPLVIILGDTDGDGLVGRDEFEAIDWTRASIDTDGDGLVSRKEFADARRRIYDQADSDRSTTLGRSELEAAPNFTLFRF